MVQLQEYIHSLELGKGAGILKIAVGVLLLVTLGVWYDLNEFRNFSTAEAMEASQLARNLANGEGFTTKCVRPLSVYLVGQHQGPGVRLGHNPHPDLATPPVYPLLLAGLLKVVNPDYEITPRFWRYPPELAIAIFNQFLFLLAVALTFLLARKLCDRVVAWVTAILMLGSDLLWRFSVSGLSTHLLLLEFVGLLWLLVTVEQAGRDGSRGSRWFLGMAVGIGVLLGLGTLTRYSFGWLVFPVLGFCAWWVGSRRVTFGVAVVAAFLVVVTPWLVRNYQASGHLFGVAGYALQQDTLPFPDARLERSLDPVLEKIELRDYGRKLLVNLLDMAQNDLTKLGGGGWAASFFLVALLLRFRNPALGRLKLFALATLALLVVVQALGRTHLSVESPGINSENLLVLLTPVVFLFGAAFFFVMVDQLNIMVEELRFALVALFVTLTSSTLLLTLLPPRTFPIVYPPYLPPWIQETSRLLGKDELMMSDMPWAVAWYGDRLCIWNTLDTRASFFKIYDEQKTIAALYLTPVTTDARYLTQMLQGPDYEWSRFALEVLTRQSLPAQFPLQHARRRYAPDQLFLCDRARWKE